MARAGSDLASALGSGGAPVVIAPIPTTAARIRARGYNQAALLAERAAVSLRLPVRPLLRRVTAGASQTALPPDARRENVRDAFAVASGGNPRGLSVLLVDDVLTTGATAAEAAGTLASAGVERVAVLAFARALPGVTANRSGTAAA
jgi:predicted amidophosphoribosyltransferase